MRQTEIRAEGIAAVAWGIVVIASLAAWVRHVIWSVQMLASEEGATAGQMVLAGIGAFMPPIGTIHGFIIWFT